MKILSIVNPGVRAAFIWVCVIILFGTIAVNRINLSGDTAYQWIDSQKYSDAQGVDIITNFTRWDAVWFINLSKTGYDYQGKDVMSNVVFFPLYPAVVKILSSVTFSKPEFVGFVGNALFTIIASGLLFTYARKNPHLESAEFPVYAMLAFPTAIFLLAPYSESLFLLLSILYVTLLAKKQYGLALAIGLLASLTRSIGFLLVLFAIANAWKYWKFEERWKLALPMLAPIGTFCFFLYEKFRFGSFFTYFNVESAWGRAFAVNWDHLWLGSAAATSQFILDAALLLFVLACGAYFVRKKFYIFGAYSVLIVLLPVSTGTLMSVGRYALAAFPLFFIPALLRSPLARTAWFFCSVLLFGMTAMLFLQGHWAG